MEKRLSILKEHQPNELRVIQTPTSISRFVQAGYRVLVEEGAGEHLQASDDDYRNAGCEVVGREDAWRGSDILIKYKPPVNDEFQYLNCQKHLCAVFHAEGNPSLVKKLLSTSCMAYSYEFFKTPSGVFPLSVASSEIAGQVAVLYAAYHLQSHLGGRGILLAPVPNVTPPKVVVIGHGNSGGAAARLAAAMGGDVTVFGRDRERLRAFQAAAPGITCKLNTPADLATELENADIVLGAILISTYDTAPIITEDMVKRMKRGSVIVDITSGYGPGYIETFNQETTFYNPTFKRHGVIHTKIDVLPLAYHRTSVEAMSQHLAPYLLELCEALTSKGEPSETAKAGMIVKNGMITHAEVERHMRHYGP